MTDLAAEPIPATTLDAWGQQLEQLKQRYRHVRPPILAALNILLSDANVTVEDAKARAALRGVRITAASLNAAKTLLSRMDAPQAAPATAAPTITPPPVPRAPRRQRTPQPPLDAEGMIRDLVGRMQSERDSEVQRLKDAVRKAIAALQAVVG
jgi:hypothetical protein